MWDNGSSGIEIQVDKAKGSPCPAQEFLGWPKKRGGESSPRKTGTWRMSLGATEAALGWFGEASHHRRPGIRTSVTSQDSLRWRKGLLQPQPWHRASLRSFCIPPGCGAHKGPPWVDLPPHTR